MRGSAFLLKAAAGTMLVALLGACGLVGVNVQAWAVGSLTCWLIALVLERDGR